MSRSLCFALCFVLLADGATANAQARQAASTGRTIAIREELALVLLQSRQYDDAAREFRALVWQFPSNRSYRLNLARALAWGEHFAAAERELRALSAQQRSVTVDSLLLSVRQALEPASYEARRWLADRPGSLEYRRILARALTREGRLNEALAQYDTLIPRDRTADVLLERAYAHMQQRNHSAAEADLFASIAMGATVDALIMLGDLRRWRGDLGSAHSLYSHARRLAPSSSDVAAAFSRLARDERPAAAFMPQASDGPGWQTTSSSVSDNLGTFLTTVAVRRGFAAPHKVEGSAGVKALRLNDRFVGGAGDIAAPEDASPVGNGYGADVALAGEANYQELYARARVRGGFVQHPTADLLPDASLTLSAWVRAWGASFEASTQPAYMSLVTLASFLPFEDTQTQMQEHATAVSVAGPLGTIDVAGRRQSSWFSDGNTRTSLEGFARLPVRPQLALLYAGSSLAFAEPSPLYWDPLQYTVHSVGAELALRRWRGWSTAVRLLPGFARATERSAADPDSLVESSTVQLTAGAEAGYRSDSWEFGTTLGYGRGRTGSYERFDVQVQVRYTP